MTEGELKDKIVRLEMFGQDLVDSKEVLKLINEAKKDFPNYNKILNTKDWDSPTSRFADAVNQWFEKWFGDSP